MWSQFCSLAYRAARHVMTLDVTVVVWLTRANLRLPEVAESEYTFQFLSPDELRELARDETTGLDGSMAKRIAQGNDFCFAALAGERLASYAWFALDSIEAAYNRGTKPASGVAVSFPTNVAFLYKGFTHPAFRGRKLHGAVIGRALLELAPLGIDAMLSTTEWTNRAARRALAGMGFEEVGRCYRWGWGNWMQTHPPASAVRRGVRFGDEAATEPRRRAIAGLSRT